VPVRISLGTPKFWPAAERLPAVAELMPPGWVLGEPNDERAERGYLAKLDRIGVDRILGRLDAIAAEHDGAALALACYEADPRACHRSWAAKWLLEQIGIAVPEIEARSTVGPPAAANGQMSKIRPGPGRILAATPDDPAQLSLDLDPISKENP
jgi:hypothetical protein